MPLTDYYEQLSDKIKEIFNQLTPSVIEAGESIDAVPVIPQDDLDSLEEEISDITDELLEMAKEGIDNPQTDEAESKLTAAKAITAYFAGKTILDGLNRIYTATVARQIDDKEEAIDQAIETTENQIESIAINEIGSSIGEFQEDIATESGYPYYRYLTADDDVVRSEHRRRDNKIFRYGAERTADDVPHKAFRCRCQAEPLTTEEARGGDFFYPEDAPEAIEARGNFLAMNKIDIKAEAQTVDVTGFIDWWDDNDFAAIKRKVDADATEDLTLNITSHGGMAMEGMATYSFFKSLGRKIVSNIYGYAGSAATMLIAASDHVTIGESDMVLIHNASADVYGDAEDLRNVAKTLDDVTGQYVKAYMSKTGQSEDSVIELMSQDRYITAQEALEFGLVDEIRADSPKSIEARKGITANGDFIIAANARLPELKDEDEMTKEEIQALEDKVANLENTVAAKDLQIEKLEGDVEAIKSEDEIRADEREKIAASAKLITDARKDVEDRGFTAKGDTRTDILANAMRDAGFSVNEGEKEEVVETLFKATAPKMSSDTDIFNDLDGKSNKKDESVKSLDELIAENK